MKLFATLTVLAAASAFSMSAVAAESYDFGSLMKSGSHFVKAKKGKKKKGKKKNNDASPAEAAPAAPADPAAPM